MAKKLKLLAKKLEMLAKKFGNVGQEIPDSLHPASASDKDIPRTGNEKTLPQNVLYGILPYPLYGAFRGIMVQNPHF